MANNKKLARRKTTMENTQDINAEAVRSSACLGALPDCDGWYAAYYPPQAHEAIVRVRYDGERGERVVDVVGQPLKQSEELWRYKEWRWSERLTLTAPNEPSSASGRKPMIEEQAKRRAVGEIEWVIAKLKTHAEMGASRPVNEATLRLMPSVEQCRQLAERLGAALVKLQDKP